MQILFDIGAVIIGYLLGSIPFGLVIVKLKTGKDIRKVESGRTGGTNAVRAAGFGAGLLTAVMDILKGAVAVWLAQAISPEHHLIHVLAPLAAILGHNHSIFLAERDENGRLRLRGGAGGAPAVGGAMGLWAPIFPIVIAAGAIVWFTLGIASLATMTVPLVIIIMFAIRAGLGQQEAIDIWYGVIAEILLIWALRPNIQKLLAGNERVIKYSLNGWLRARKNKTKPTKQ
jgi:acyl phosphate:glycerol-3-phosphate acyltransferase